MKSVTYRQTDTRSNHGLLFLELLSPIEIITDMRVVFRWRAIIFSRVESQKKVGEKSLTTIGEAMYSLWLTSILVVWTTPAGSLKVLRESL